MKRRSDNEQTVSGILTVMSVFSIIMVWFKLKKSMSGKLILGQFGASTKAHVSHGGAESYI